MAETKQRVRRTTEQIVAEIDEKIAYHERCIETLKVKKADALTPKARKKRATAKNILDKAKENGLTMEEIAEKLGIEL